MTPSDPGASAALAAAWMALAVSGLVLAASWLTLAVAGCASDAGGLSHPGGAAPATASWDDVGPAPCPPGAWSVDGVCTPAETAFAAPGRTTYVVDGSDPSASDGNPGTSDQPWRTISRAARAGALRPGDAVLIRAGVYREAVRPASGGTGPDARVTFAALPGETVVVTGADRADDGWTRQPNGGWRRPWTGGQMLPYSDDPTFRLELMAADGRVLRPVGRRAELASGRFWREGPDAAPVALVARFEDGRPPSQAGLVEVGTRRVLFAPLGPDPYAGCGDPATPGWIRVVGITFRHATNRAQEGAVCAGSEGGLFEDVRVEWTNGLGIDASGREHTFLRTRADLNGQMGWGGSCQRCLFDETAAVGNNWKGHDPGWEAGGGKWTETSDSVFRRHYAAHNDGPGLWLDGDNHRNTIEGGLLVGNRGAGVMLELNTTGTLVQHTVVAGTRWVEWTGSGVLSQAASGNAFVHNTVVANEGTGLWLRLDPERRAPDGGNVVANSWIVGNAASDHEAREVAVEGLSPAHVRTNTFEGNAYGRRGRDLFRSTFFVHPAPEWPADFRSDDLAGWRRLVGGDRTARLVGPGERVAASAVGPVEAGAAGAGVVPFDRVGADPSRVRAGGDWRHAPPTPWWPR
ncbi:right-handed parallel beta-helix repeat-containing protein [Rubrivirga sp.]|uniref:right-handed parallel beta-helix repeat-containing protein n=1 Tax=Rubrivirga sp. TaxID=1885344 RepID=UPI003B52E5C0